MGCCDHCRTVETQKLVEARLRVGDDNQLAAITFSHGLGQFQSLATVGFGAGRARANKFKVLDQ